jgi:hypothetical protein
MFSWFVNTICSWFIKWIINKLCFYWKVKTPFIIDSLQKSDLWTINYKHVIYSIQFIANSLHLNWNVYNLFMSYRKYNFSWLHLIPFITNSLHFKVLRYSQVVYDSLKSEIFQDLFNTINNIFIVLQMFIICL